MKLKGLWISLAVLTVGAVVTVPVVMTLITQTKPELKKPSDNGLAPPVTETSIVQTKEIKFDTNTNTILGWSDELLDSEAKPTHLELPDEINGHPVESIDRIAFCDSGLRSVKLPVNLINTGEQSFSNNFLTEIEFPKSLSKIDWASFSNNNFKELVIPGRIKTIDKDAFANNEELTKLVIKDGVEEIKSYAFGDCPISDLDLGNTLSTIGAAAFLKHNLTELTIPESVEYIGGSAFTQPTQTDKNPGIINLHLSSTTNLTIGSYAFARNKIKEFTVTNNLTIGAEAFHRNPIGKITFDDEVAKEVSESSGHFNYDQTKIGLGAFSLIEIPTDQRVLKQNFIMPHMWFHDTAVWDRLFNRDMNFWFDVIRCKTADVCDLA